MIFEDYTPKEHSLFAKISPFFVVSNVICKKNLNKLIGGKSLCSYVGLWTIESVIKVWTIEYVAREILRLWVSNKWSWKYEQDEEENCEKENAQEDRVRFRLVGFETTQVAMRI